MTLAIIFDDTHFAPERWTLLSLCAFLPLLVVVASWALIRWKKALVGVAGILAGLAAWMILSRMYEQFARFELYRTNHPNDIAAAPVEEMVAPWFAAIVPFAMIALFYLTEKTPNQAPEPTAPGGRGSS